MSWEEQLERSIAHHKALEAKVLHCKKHHRCTDCAHTLAEVARLTPPLEPSCRSTHYACDCFLAERKEVEATRDHYKKVAEQGIAETLRLRGLIPEECWGGHRWGDWEHEGNCILKRHCQFCWLAERA